MNEAKEKGRGDVFLFLFGFRKFFFLNLGSFFVGESFIFFLPKRWEKGMGMFFVCLFPKVFLFFVPRTRGEGEGGERGGMGWMVGKVFCLNGLV